MKKNRIYLIVILALLIGAVGTAGAIYAFCGTSDYNSTYDGTYDEDVLRRLNQDIIIGDEHVSLPCSLEELGPNFTYLTNTQSGSIYDSDESNGDTTASILWKGEYVGMVWYHMSYDENHDYSKDPILRLYLTGQDINWSVGGIKLKKSNSQKIVETLGVPTELKKGENNLKVYNYGIEQIQIVVDGSDQVRGFWMTANTDPIRESSSEIIPYDGSWHEGSLNQLNRDIVIQGRSFPMPFSVNDLGLGFTLDRGPKGFYIREAEELNAVVLDLHYHGKAIGSVLYKPSQEPNHDYRQDPVRAFCPIFNEECRISIAGMVPGEITREELSEKLGKPIREDVLFGGNRLMIYEDHGFAAEIDSDGKAEMLYLEDPAHRLSRSEHQ